MQIYVVHLHSFTNIYNCIHYYIYSHLSGGWCWYPSGCCWCPSWWLVLVSFLVAVRILPAGGGVLPAGSGVLPAGGCLPAGGVSAASIFAAGGTDRGTDKTPQCGGGLASESKLQGKIDRCDYSYYQLFRYSFRVSFYISLHRLKR